MLRIATLWLLTLALVCSGVVRVRQVAGADATSARCCCGPTAPSCCAPASACGCRAQAPEPEPTAPVPATSRLPDLAPQSDAPVLTVTLAALPPAPRNTSRQTLVPSHARPRQAELRTFLI